MARMKQIGTIDVEKNERPKSAAFGIGGAGRNIITSFNKKKFPNVEIYEVGEENRLDMYPSIKIFKKDLEKAFRSNVPDKLRDKTDSEKVLLEKMKQFDIIYLFCGLGGEIGSWTSNLCSNIANRNSLFTVALFTTPFKSENPRRVEFANKMKSDINSSADISVEFSNNKLLEINPYLPLTKAFKEMNNIISLPMEDLNKVLKKESIIKLKDFCRGIDEFSIGKGEGKGREKGKRALNEALRSPWLDKNHRNVISLITKGKKSDDMDVKDILESLNSEYRGSNILYGISKDESIGKRIRVTLLAGR